MADVPGVTRRIHDAVQDSKIRKDSPSKPYQKFDSFASEENRDLDGWRHHLYYGHHHVGRDFPRTTTDGVAAGSYRSSYMELNTMEGAFRRVVIEEKLPTFDGSSCKLDFLDWIDTFEDYFEVVNLTDAMKCKLVASKLKGAARTWWKELLHTRFLEGKNPISLWSRMRDLLHSRFVHTSHLTYFFKHKIQDDKKPPNCLMNCPSEVDNSCKIMNSGHNILPGPVQQINEEKGKTCEYNAEAPNTVDEIAEEKRDKSTLNKCLMKGLLENPNINSKDAESNQTAVRNYDDSEDSLVEGQSEETYELKPAACSTEVPLESDVDKPDEENELKSRGVSEDTYKDDGMGTLSPSIEGEIESNQLEGKPQGLDLSNVVDMCEDESESEQCLRVKSEYCMIKGLGEKIHDMPEEKKILSNEVLDYTFEMKGFSNGKDHFSSSKQMAKVRYVGHAFSIGSAWKMSAPCKYERQHTAWMFGKILIVNFDPGGILCSVGAHSTSLKDDQLALLLLQNGFVVLRNRDWKHGVLMRDEALYRGIHVHTPFDSLVFIMRIDCGTCVQIPIHIGVMYSYLGFHELKIEERSLVYDFDASANKELKRNDDQLEANKVRFLSGPIKNASTLPAEGINCWIGYFMPCFSFKPVMASLALNLVFENIFWPCVIMPNCRVVPMCVNAYLTPFMKVYICGVSYMLCHVKFHVDEILMFAFDPGGKWMIVPNINERLEHLVVENRASGLLVDHDLCLCLKLSINHGRLIHFPLMIISSKSSDSTLLDVSILTKEFRFRDLQEDVGRPVLNDWKSLETFVEVKGQFWVHEFHATVWLLMRYFPMLRNRMLADSFFLCKVATEMVIDTCCLTFVKVKKRGKDFWAEFGVLRKVVIMISLKKCEDCEWESSAYGNYMAQSCNLRKLCRMLIVSFDPGGHVTATSMGDNLWNVVNLLYCCRFVEQFFDPANLHLLNSELRSIVITAFDPGGIVFTYKTWKHVSSSLELGLVSGCHDLNDFSHMLGRDIFTDAYRGINLGAASTSNSWTIDPSGRLE